MSKIKSKIISVFNKLVRKTSWYKSLWGGAEKIYKLNTFGLQVVNTGSGSGMHNFNYEGIPIKGFNFALGPQSLVHDFNILKNYFSYFQKNCTVLIPICPFSGLVVKYNKEHNFKYYPMLHPATISNFDESERTKAYQLYRSPFSVIPKECVIKTTREFMRKFLSIVKRNLKKIVIRKTVPKNHQKSADDLIKGWKAQFSITELSAPISSSHISEIKSRKETLCEMLDFCTERGFKPVVVMPPMHSSLYNQIPEAFKLQYIKPLVDAVINKGYAFIDYSRDSRFLSDSYYASALFLNDLGAKYFTKQLLTDLNLI